MKKFLKKLWKAISEPFIACSVLVDETRRENLDGRYDRYWERRNKREAHKR